MSDIHWANATSGLSADGASWVGGKVPNGSDIAYLGATGANYTVTDSVSVIVGGLRVSSNATFEVKYVTGIGPNFESFNIVNDGVIKIHRAAMTTGGEFINYGKLTLINGNVQLGGMLLSGGGILRFDGRKDTILGDGSGANFQNVDNTIVTGTGDGLIKGGQSFTNDAAGKVIQTGLTNLTIRTGHQIVINNGLFESEGAGGFRVGGALESDGTIVSIGGAITVEGKVTGTGSVVIDGGSVTFGNAFDEAVSFGSTGMLVLSRSPGFKATVTGVSTGTAFDLTDIGFVSSGEATFKGNASGGTLTVTDGVHYAHIALAGDYLGATFNAASDGMGGVLVTESMSPIHQFIEAAASLRGDPAPKSHTPEIHGAHVAILAPPHCAIA